MLTRDYDYLAGDTFHGDWLALIIGDLPIDLSSGWTVRAQVVDRSTRAEILDLGVQHGTATVSVGGVPTSVATVRIHIPASVSESADVYVGSYDVEVSHPTFDSGVEYRRTVTGGVLRARKDVTRGV